MDFRGKLVILTRNITTFTLWFDSYSVVIRWLFDCYSIVIQLLFNCYSIVIRWLFDGYSIVIQ